jgi:hypothetical protein
MTRTTQPTSNATTYHRDGTITIWNCIDAQWERGANLSDELLSTLSREEWARVMAHINPAHADAGATLYKGHAITLTGSYYGARPVYAISGAMAAKDACVRPFITSLAHAREYISDRMC